MMIREIFSTGPMRYSMPEATTVLQGNTAVNPMWPSIERPSHSKRLSALPDNAFKPQVYEFSVVKLKKPKCMLGRLMSVEARTSELGA